MSGKYTGTLDTLNAEQPTRRGYLCVPNNSICSRGPDGLCK